MDKNVLVFLDLVIVVLVLALCIGLFMRAVYVRTFNKRVRQLGFPQLCNTFLGWRI